MKKLQTILLVTIGVVQLNISVGQTLENDTVFIKRSVHTKETEIDTVIIKNGISPAQPKILIGTTFLPYSEKMIGLLNHGISPISLELVDDCNNSVDPGTFKNYPIFKELRRDSTTLTIVVSIVANCCHNFLGEAELIGGDTLNLIYTSYGGFCSCECCYTLKYRFNTEMEEHYVILNKVTINGSKQVGQIPKKE